MAKLKPVVKEGKVGFANKKFYVSVGGKRQAIPTGPAVDAGALKKLVGQTVPITLVGKTVVAIGKRPGILCYKPAPELFSLIQPDIQKVLQKKYTEAGIITAD